MNRIPDLTLIFVALAVFAASCTEAPTESAPEPSSIEIIAGDAQSAPVRTAVPVTPVVRVADSKGRPVPHVGIVARVIGNNGTLGDTDSVRWFARTDHDGRATLPRWTLGSSSGLNLLEVSVSPGLSDTISAHGSSGEPRQLVLLDSVRGPLKVVSRVTPGFAVQLVDAYGNGIAGESISGSSPDSGMALDSAAWRTDPDGRAQITGWQLGYRAGQQSLDLRWDGLHSGMVLSLRVRVEASAASPMSIMVGQNAPSTSRAGRAIDAPISLRVHDRYGNPTPGARLSLALTAGSGHLYDTTTVADANGNARVSGWILGLSGGINTIVVRSNSTQVAHSIHGYQQGLVAGYDHYCGLTSDGFAYCWGSNTRGQLGTGDTLSRTRATKVNTSARFTALYAGPVNTCGLDSAGGAWCWGGSENGQLGVETSALLSPRAVLISDRFFSLALGLTHSCGITIQGAVVCWGHSAQAGLGNAYTGLVLTPTPVAVQSRLMDVVTSMQTTCARDTDLRVYCWGFNFSGQAGVGDQRNILRFPSPIANTLPFLQISVGSETGCGVSSSFSLLCWGRNDLGEVGDGTRINRRSPTLVAGDLKVSVVVSGSNHTCARDLSLRWLCWGNNGSFQLGSTLAQFASTPTLLADTFPFISLAPGNGNSCGLSSDGVAWCWGMNNTGQLGDGTRTNSSSAREVLDAVPFIRPR